MEIQISMNLLTDLACDKLKSVGFDVKKVFGTTWLLGIKLPEGQTVAAYSISRINPLAPPSIYMTDSECHNGIDNREYP